VPAGPEVIQECEAGLIRIRRDGTRLAFAAPPLIRSGEIDEQTLERIFRALRISDDDVVAAQWVDNGPGWAALMLHDRAAVLDLVPDLNELAGINLGVVARWGGDADFEVRAFVPGDGMAEDPVTGSLNAGIAQWLIGAGLAPPAYVASQGTALGRAGRVYIEQRGADTWVGGDAVACIEGTVRF
jgi:PhzF family phenazine biosynthesis protein